MSTGQREKTPEIDASSVLEGLPDPAVVIDKDHRILVANTAYQEKYNGGADLCGRHCFEISHGYPLPCDEIGERCPLRDCTEFHKPYKAIHVHHTNEAKELEEVTAYRLAGGDSFLEVLRRLDIATPRPSARQLVGSSNPFKAMLELVTRVAPHETTVLLLGESGTGKDLVARAVHNASPRADGKFVPVDCSGLSATLFESELFGHEKGAFTGADSRKIGLVEAASGGTLFLDELGDIPLPMQVKLLRLVETRLFRRVGSSELREADFRLVCATHRDLRAMVDARDFRRDLYYRISTFPIELPPLRERLDDLPQLVKSFGRRLRCKGLGHVPDETLAHLRNYGYPGNVRELLNIVERACLLSDGGAIRPEYLPREVLDASGQDPPLEPVSASRALDRIVPLDEAEKRYLRWVVQRFSGSKRELASRLAVSERTLYRKLSAIVDS